MMGTIYRMRPANDRTLEEINEQYIFFASPEQLNDPMEGFRDVFWSGDSVIWANLIRHYIYCTQRVFDITMLSDAETLINEESIPIFNSLDDFPCEQYRKIYCEIEADILTNTSIIELINTLSESTRLIRESELTTYIKLLHYIVLDTIQGIYIRNNLIGSSAPSNSASKTILDNFLHSGGIVEIDRMFRNNSKDERQIDAFFALLASLSSEIALIHKLTDTYTNSNTNLQFLWFDLPEAFVKKTAKLMHPDWYTASFMADCTNSSVWGHYANGHRGVCLIFKTNETTRGESLPLRTAVSYSSSGIGYAMQDFSLRNVKYQRQYPEIDFFRSLGRLPLPQILNHWYTDKNGIISRCNKCFESEDEWRDAYWKMFYESALTKSDDWAYEKEIRLILSSSLFELHNDESRKLKYDFTQLDGIIFGINTTTEFKRDAISCIRNKCIEHERSSFKFSQAFYCHHEKTIKSRELPLLKFNATP